MHKRETIIKKEYRLLCHRSSKLTWLHSCRQRKQCKCSILALRLLVTLHSLLDLPWIRLNNSSCFKFKLDNNNCTYSKCNNNSKLLHNNNNNNNINNIRRHLHNINNNSLLPLPPLQLHMFIQTCISHHKHHLFHHPQTRRKSKSPLLHQHSPKNLLPRLLPRNKSNSGLRNVIGKTELYMYRVKSWEAVVLMDLPGRLQLFNESRNNGLDKWQPCIKKSRKRNPFHFPCKHHWNCNWKL